MQPRGGGGRGRSIRGVAFEGEREQALFRFRGLVLSDEWRSRRVAGAQIGKPGCTTSGAAPAAGPPLSVYLQEITPSARSPLSLRIPTQAAPGVLG